MLEAVSDAIEEGEFGDSLKYTPLFHDGYQAWFSEARTLVKQVLPDSLEDFLRHYSSSKPKEYSLIANLLQGDHGMGVSIPISHLRQQIAIVKAARVRFESSLYEIRQLVVADLFDSELDAAQELQKKKFLRPAGVLAGLVLENHLRDVCQQRGVPITKTRPTIGDFTKLLRNHGILDLPQSRRIEYLADIRNLCSHKRDREPAADEVADLIRGVTKTVKTVF